MTDAAPKEPLYHYTSNIGLIGILTKGEIWRDSGDTILVSRELRGNVRGTYNDAN
jgi:hypothetical protein